MSNKIPLIALIGLPNSGKSSLLNKLTGTRKAVVAKEEHTTRDLNYGEDFWEGMFFRIVDTGGLVPDPADKIQKAVQIRSWAGIAESDLLVWVIDRRQDPDTLSEKIIQKIWKTNKPVLICINKVDDPNQDKNIADYAKLGGFDFANVSAVTGYGLGDLMDVIVKKLDEMGFEKNEQDLPEIREKVKVKKHKSQTVKKHKDGGYYIVRDEEGLFESLPLEENTQDSYDSSAAISTEAENKTPKVLLLGKPNVGKSSLFNTMVGKDIQIVTDIPGTTLSVNDTLIEKLPKLKQQTKIKNILLDLIGVVFENETTQKEILKTKQFIIKNHDKYNFYYLSDSDELVFEELLEPETFKYFKGGLASFESEFYDEFLEKFEILSEDTLFIGDNEDNLESAINLGLNTSLYSQELDLEAKITEINLDLLEKTKKQYILLDSAGIRKPGQRILGAETFATFRTIQAAYESDVICLVLDASEPLTHQDQVVAGICKEARKGVVIIANKSDIIDPEQKAKFLKDFYHKFEFLKIEQFIWVSAKSHENLNQIWQSIDVAMENRSKIIDRNELRKLFNYILKQKPPKKLRLQKRPVIYDLLYTKSAPPTFELLVKDKKTIHWSFTRFLENIIRKQFNFTATEIVVKMVEIDRKKVITS